MKQVLFWLPTPWGELPIYGFGMMLFVTFVSCYWLVGRRAEKEGIPKEHLHDLSIWIFIGGIVGARIVYMIQYGIPFWPPWNFFKIWEGGLVFYGSALGGLAGYVLAYFTIIRKHHLNTWQLADVIAPAVALGLALGRVGCLLNGCCYGHVACPDCPAVPFPLSAPARYTLVRSGLQTAAGFAVNNPAGDPRSLVTHVDPSSAAAESGLRSGDVIVEVDGVPNDVKFLEVRASQGQLDQLAATIGRDPEVLLWRDGDGGTGVWQYQFVDASEFGRALEAIRKPGAVLDYNVYDRLWDSLVHHWPRGKTELTLAVQRDGQREALPPFVPLTLGLHPTQLYETISAGLLFLLLLAYEPFRRRKGELMVILMLTYPVHRFINESLRNDTDRYRWLGSPVALTLSQWLSICLFLGGLVVLALLLRKPPDAAAVPETETPAEEPAIPDTAIQPASDRG